ncbi:MAG: MFS transporter [Novosphingobium sp.]|nr:MFS transporter [Novosphingobium sp.]
MSGRQDARREWIAHWPLVLAAMIGLSFTSVAAASIGLLMTPLADAFAWSRAQISLGLTIYALVAVPLSPFVGALIDRWGPRRLAIPGTILSALCFAAFGLMNGSIAQWLSLWLMYAIVTLAIKATVWTAAVSRAFSAGRGLALALTLSGSAIAMTLVPVLAQWIIDSYGWRQAYYALGLGWGGFVLLWVAMFFRDGRSGSAIRHAPGNSQVPTVDMPGLELKEALRSIPLVKLAVATVTSITVISAVAIHQIPILTEGGLTREAAAGIAATAGASSIVDKLATGWMMDRWGSLSVAGASVGLPAGAFFLLSQGHGSVSLTTIAIVLLGYGNGAFIQLSAYLTGRYAGLRNFGKIFGVMASLIALGLGLGPLSAGFIFDLYGSYDLLLWSGIPAMLACGILVATLGPFPRFQDSMAKG